MNPSAVRLHQQRPLGKLFEIVMGVAGFLLFFAMTIFILLQAEDFLTRKGRFGGGGAEIVWLTPVR